MSDHFDISDVVLKHLSEQMRCFAVTNARGDVIIVHELETTSPIAWVEYEANQRDFALIHDAGRLQGLGVSIDMAMHENLLNCQTVLLAQAQGQEIVHVQKVTLVVKTY